jgi:hypothetical protein
MVDLATVDYHLIDDDKYRTCSFTVMDLMKSGESEDIYDFYDSLSDFTETTLHNCSGLASAHSIKFLSLYNLILETAKKCNSHINSLEFSGLGLEFAVDINNSTYTRDLNQIYVLYESYFNATVSPQVVHISLFGTPSTDLARTVGKQIQLLSQTTPIQATVPSHGFVTGNKIVVTDSKYPSANNGTLYFDVSLHPHLTPQFWYVDVVDVDNLTLRSSVYEFTSSANPPGGTEWGYVAKMYSLNDTNAYMGLGNPLALLKAICNDLVCVFYVTADSSGATIHLVSRRHGTTIQKPERLKTVSKKVFRGWGGIKISRAPIDYRETGRTEEEESTQALKDVTYWNYNRGQRYLALKSPYVEMYYPVNTDENGFTKLQNTHEFKTYLHLSDNNRLGCYSLWKKCGENDFRPITWVRCKDFGKDAKNPANLSGRDANKTASVTGLYCVWHELIRDAWASYWCNEHGVYDGITLEPPAIYEETYVGALADINPMDMIDGYSVFEIEEDLENNETLIRRANY